MCFDVNITTHTIALTLSQRVSPNLDVHVMSVKSIGSPVLLASLTVLTELT